MSLSTEVCNLSHLETFISVLTLCLHSRDCSEVTTSDSENSNLLMNYSDTFVLSTSSSGFRLQSPFIMVVIVT